jgi:hypothetical protein
MEPTTAGLPGELSITEGDFRANLALHAQPAGYRGSTLGGVKNTRLNSNLNA